MTYATADQCVEKFGRAEAIDLTNLDDPTAEEIDTIVLSRAIEDASALIDSYLSGRYSLPFADAPQVLIPRCLDIARYSLDRTSAREDVRQRYEDAIRWLEMVAKGVVNLGLTATNTEVKGSENYPDFEAGDRVFTNSSLQDFVGS